jgi:hypothetical protein
MLSIRFSGPIAQAVAAEIFRIERDDQLGPLGPSRPVLFLSEGTAYKAAWDRLGGNALRHCEAYANDAAIMNIATRAAPGCMARGIAAVQQVTA